MISAIKFFDNILVCLFPREIHTALISDATHMIGDHHVVMLCSVPFHYQEYM